MKDGEPIHQHQYKRLKQLRIPVWLYPERTDVYYVAVKDIEEALKPTGGMARFHQLFGIQTMCDLGPYPWDVEAVLERMISGEMTGTQLDPD